MRHVVWSCSTFLPRIIKIFQRVFDLQSGYEINELSLSNITKGDKAIVRKAELSFLYATSRLVLFYISAKYHRNIPKGIPVTEQTRNLFQTKQRERTPNKIIKAELSFLYATHRLVLFYISTKYHKIIPKGL